MKLRTAVTSLVAVAVGLSAAAPASAAPTFEMTAKAQNLGNPLTLSTMRASVECAARVEQANGTGIVDCSLRGVTTGETFSAEIDQNSMYGERDATAGIVEVPTTQRYQACVTARILWGPDSNFYADTQCFDV